MTSVSNRSSSVASFKVMDVLEQANRLSAAGHEVMHCEVGQPETGAPPLVSQAAVEALNSGTNVMGYTDAFGLLPLRERIAQHYTTKYKNLSKAPETSRIVVTTGSSGGFLLAFTACFDAGDTVAIASAGYPCYRNILSALGCELAHIDVNQEFKLTCHELRTEVEKRKSNTKAKPIKGLILSSPSNPTGAMLSPQELKELCDYCETEGIQFISDEIYHGISYGKEEATALEFSSNALVINSFSKYYSMSGWRLGWMVVPSGLVSAINSLQQNMFINAPTISQTAAMKCWDEGTIEELEKHVTKYRTSRSLILEALSKLPGLNHETNIAPADGGFYVYVDLGEENVAPGLGSVAMCSALLEEEHVAFTPGIDFEDPSTSLGDRRFRISYAGGIDTATKAMERLTKFWPSWTEKVKDAKGKPSKQRKVSK